MKKSNKFSPEFRESAVRMVQEHRGDYPKGPKGTPKPKRFRGIAREISLFEN